MELFEIAVLRKVGEVVTLLIPPKPIMAKDAKAAEYYAVVHAVQDNAALADELEVRVRPFVGA